MHCTISHTRPLQFVARRGLLVAPFHLSQPFRDLLKTWHPMFWPLVVLCLHYFELPHFVSFLARRSCVVQDQLDEVLVRGAVWCLEVSESINQEVFCWWHLHCYHGCQKVC